MIGVLEWIVIALLSSAAVYVLRHDPRRPPT
jgi:hypothetical protein